LLQFNSIYNHKNFLRHFGLPNVIQFKGAWNNIDNIIQNDLPRYLVLDSFFKKANLHLKNVREIFYVSNEPSLEEVKNFLKLLPKEKIQIISVGGGSTLDFAKLVKGHRAFPGVNRIGYDIPRSKFETVLQEEDELIALPTTVSAGSESSRYGLAFDNDGKKPQRAWCMVPELVILDASFLESFSSEQLLVQLFDSWTHAFEVQIASGESSKFVNRLVETNCKSISHFLQKINDSSPFSKDDLEEMQLCAFFAGNAISNVRTGALHTVGEALASQDRTLRHIPSLYLAAKNYHMLLGDYQGNMWRDETFLFEFWDIRMKELAEFIKFLRTQFNEELMSLSSLDLLKLRFDVESDHVLWEKEHPAIVSTINLTNYLNETIKKINEPGF
jgi:hypothetical protein